MAYLQLICLDKQQSMYRKLIIDIKKIAPMRRMITEEFLLSDHSFFESINHVDQVKNHLSMLGTEHMIGYFADFGFSLFRSYGTYDALSCKQTGSYYVYYTTRISLGRYYYT